MKMLPIPGRSGQEGRISKFIVDALVRGGVPETWIESDETHRKSPFGGEAGNLICRFPGTRRGRRRLFMAHIDTVPLCVGSKPVLEGSLIRPESSETALGADDRSGSAVLLHTALELLRHEIEHPPVVFFWAVQEEVGIWGVRNAKLSLLQRPKLCYNFDGRDPHTLTVAATGGYRMTIRVHGVASHAGGAPEKGVSAITAASLAIAELHASGWHGLIERNGKTGTSNVGVFHGGEATNVVTPYVEIRAEARSHDSAFRVQIVRAIEEAFERAARQVQNVDGETARVEIEGHLDYDSFRLDDDEPCVLEAEQAIRDCGGEPVRAISDGGLDANWMALRGLPTVTLGCGQINIHTVAERLDLDAFHEACRIAMRLATS